MRAEELFDRVRVGTGRVVAAMALKKRGIVAGADEEAVMRVATMSVKPPLAA